MERDNIHCHKGSYREEYVGKLKERLSNKCTQVCNDARFGSIPPREPPVL